MKTFLSFLCILIIKFISNKIVIKELPIYGLVKTENYENIFLNCDLFKVGKEIDLIINPLVKIVLNENNYIIYPNLKMNFCFSNENEDNSCAYTEDEIYGYDIDNNDFNMTLLYKKKIIMEQKYKYLLLKLEVKTSFYINITHDPFSDVIANPLLGYKYEINDSSCVYEDSYSHFISQVDEIYVELSFHSSDIYDKLKIYYENKNYNNKEFTDDLNNYIITDHFKKENNYYTFYFYLPLYNFTKNILEYKYLLFRPESIGVNNTFSAQWINRLGKKIPLYGSIKVENIKDGLFYLNIENFEKGDKIYLQFIGKVDHKALDIDYTFNDENFEENFGGVDKEITIYDKTIKDGISTFYGKIKIEDKKKYLLLQASKGNFIEITIKHTKKNEYTNTTLIIIIVIVVIIVVIAIIFIVLFILRKRKNKITSSQIEDKSLNY